MGYYIVTKTTTATLILIPRTSGKCDYFNIIKYHYACFVKLHAVTPALRTLCRLCRLCKASFCTDHARMYTHTSMRSTTAQLQVTIGPHDRCVTLSG